MRHLRNTLSIFLILLVLLASSCGLAEKKAEKLIGTWLVTDVENDPPLHGDEEEAFEESKAHIIGTGTVTFNEDGTYLYDVMGPSETGTWEITPDGKSVRMKPDNGQNNVAFIKEVNDEELVLYFGIMSVLRIYFEKT